MMSETYNFRLGEFDCAVVNDGYYTYHEPSKIMFENASPRLVQQLQADGFVRR